MWQVNSESVSADVTLFRNSRYVDYGGMFFARANIQYGWKLHILETDDWKVLHP